LNGDVLTRAGFGPHWLESDGGTGESREFARTIRFYCIAFAAFVLASCLRCTTSASRHPWSVSIDARLRLPGQEWQHLVVLAGIPLAGFALLITALTIMGMDN